jgi:hypothetical protein
MDLVKNFKLRGLWQNGSKVAITPGFFRRFTNSYKDRSGKIFPFGRGQAAGSNQSTNMPQPISGVTTAATQFKGGLLQLIQDEDTLSPTSGSAFRYSNENNAPFPIMQPYRDVFTSALFGLSSTTARAHKDSGNYTFSSVFNKTMLCRGVDTEKYRVNSSPGQSNIAEANLISFDGERAREAGLPLPWAPAGNLGAAAHYTRSLYATIGQDGEPVFSGILRLQHASTTTQVFNTSYSATPVVDYNTGRRVDPISISSSPTYRVQNDSLFNDQKYYDTRYMRLVLQGSGLTAFDGIQLVAGYPSISRGEVSRNLQAGDWLMFRIRYAFGSPSAYGFNSDLIKFQVRTVGAAIYNVSTFENEIQIFDYTTFTWVTKEFSSFWNSWSAGVQSDWIQDCASVSWNGLSNIFQITSYATTPTGNFVVNYILPYFHVSSASGPTGLSATAMTLRFNFMGVVSGNLSDWYDVSTAKTTFPPMLGVTQYKGIVVGHDNNALYFSDITLGGSSEMISGASNLVPFGAEFGKITAVCGCEDFLLISRERRNFILRGDIAGSFSLSECDLPVPGAYNSRACTNAWGGKIVFMNRIGIFTVDSVGSLVEISANIRDLFVDQNIDSNLFNKAIFKSPAQLKTTSVIGTVTRPPQDGTFIQFALDAERGFIFLLTGAKETTVDSVGPTFGDAITISGNLLVYDVNDGSWYEWECSDATAIEAYLSKLYTFSAACKIEDGVLRGSEKQIIATQYDAAGQPSLQKQVNQLKLFGRFVPTPGDIRGCKVLQQNDWEPLSGVKVTDTTYTVTDNSQYNHKQRLNSSKPMSTSIIVESLAEGGIIIDAMEVEGMILQQGVKQ